MHKYGDVKLLKAVQMQDAIGQAIGTIVTTAVIPCEINSVGQSEWSTAQQGGYSAEIELTVFAESYHGEKLAEFEGKQYEIYRTYDSGERIELYLGTRVGDIF